MFNSLLIYYVDVLILPQLLEGLNALSIGDGHILLSILE